MKVEKKHLHRSYLLGALVIIATWMVGTWQVLIDRLEVGTFQISLTMVIGFGSIMLILMLWSNPALIYKRPLKNELTLTISFILGILFFFITSFLETSSVFITEIVYGVVITYFIAHTLFPIFYSTYGKSSKLDYYYVISFGIFLFILIGSGLVLLISSNTFPITV